MTQPVRFHVLIIPTVSWPELLDRVLLVERLGFEAAALPDHLVDWTNPPAPWYDAWTALAALAQATSTIRLSTAVTQIPLRNPVMLARQVLTLDQISNGRIELGLGTGLTIDPSYRMGGFPNWAPAERVERFGEYVELVALLLSQETTTFAGRYYQADGAVMNPRPVQRPRPPITVAALGPKMMRHAVRHADIWNSLSFEPTFPEQLGETRERIAMLDRICAELVRDSATLERSYLMFDTQVRHHGGAFAYYQSPDAFLSWVEPLLELGITDVGVYFPFLPEQREMFERIATEVLPDLRMYAPPIRFRNDDAGYLAWLNEHPRGFVLNIDTNGPGKSVLHDARCRWLTPREPDMQRTSFAKACSDWAEQLERWGERQGQTVTRCNSCLAAS